MYNDDYMNNFGSSGETPPEDNSTDTGEQQPAPLEPDKVYSAPHEPGQDSRTQAPYNKQPEQNGYAQPPYNSGSYTQPQPEKKKKKMSAKKKGVAIFAAILAAVVAVSAIVTVFAKSGNSGGAGNSTSITETSEGDAELNITDTPKATTTSKTGSALTSAEVYAKVSPSNVGIVVYSQSSSSASGEGSGIVMGENKDHTCTYIITCAHVISGEGVKAVVQLHDGKQYDAEIVGYDSRTDIGVLKIKATGFTAAEFGDSTKLSVGETVYAIGNPGGTEFFGSFTNGMVSAISRTVSSQIGYSMECIQHTAAISPGNSGGALINEYGQVVGINSLKISDSNYELMGFAIPISSAKEIIDDLIAYGRVPNRPKLGISYFSNTSNQQYNMIVQIKGLPAGSLIIADINEDSDLANSSAQVGDLITAVNGKKLSTSEVLLEAIENSKVGDTLTLTLCRISSNYQTKEFNVKVKLVEDTGNTASASSKQQEKTTQQSNDSFYYNPFN